MSNQLTQSVSRQIKVPFHGADLYVVEHKEQPYTPMKPIVDGMGLAWQPQHRKLAENGARWGITEMVMPSAGGRQATICLPLRKLPGWLMSIEPGKVKNSVVRERVVRYQNECDDVLWQYWNDGIAANPRASMPTEPAHMMEARRVANGFFDSCRAAVSSVGGEEPEFPAMDESVVTGLLASVLMHSRFIVSFDHEMRMNVKPVPSESFVTTHAKIPNLIREVNDPAFSSSAVVEIMHACTERMAADAAKWKSHASHCSSLLRKVH